MANFFKNPLVLAETVVGSMIDTRALVLYEQPTDIDFNSITDNAEKELLALVDKRKLKELFTGIEVPYVSKINGFNMFGISYVQGEVDISSDLCDHPTETGSVITDNAIINPVSMKVQVAMPTGWYTRIYAQMVKMFQNKTFILVQTKFAMYRNMVIEAMPYKLENGTIDRPVIELRLRQVMEVTPQYIDSVDTGIKNPLDGEDSNTQNVGRLTAATAADEFLKTAK